MPLRLAQAKVWARPPLLIRFQNLDHSSKPSQSLGHHISPCRCQRCCLKTSIQQNKDFKDNCLNPATPSLLSLEFLEITVPITIGKCQSPLSLQLPHPLRDSNKSTTTHFMNMGSQACLAPQHMDSSHQWESSRNPETTALIQKCLTASRPT